MRSRVEHTRVRVGHTEQGHGTGSGNTQQDTMACCKRVENTHGVLGTHEADGREDAISDERREAGGPEARANGNLFEPVALQ